MLNPRTAAQIKACRGVYSVGDTARHFQVSKGTVHNIWQGRTHSAVRPSEAPYVNRSRVPASQIREDAEWLLRAGTPVEEVAKRIGVTPSRLKKEVAPALLVFA